MEGIMPRLRQSAKERLLKNMQVSRGGIEGSVFNRGEPGAGPFGR